MKIELPEEFYKLNRQEQETYLSKWYQNIGIIERQVFELLAFVRGIGKIENTLTNH